SADTVTCRDSRGRVRWTLEHFLNANVVDVRDFVGDGSRGILLTTFLAGRVDTYLVCGRTGKATHLWRDENNFGGQTRIGQLLPGVAGVQIAAAASGATPPAPQGGPVRLVSFEEGLDRPHFRVRQHVSGVFYAPLILFADLENDGRYQVQASVKNEHGDGTTRLVIFEARPGERLAELPDAEVLAVEDLDGDGKPEVLLRRGKAFQIVRWKSGDFQSVYQGL